jgi:hypothetical protein
MAKVGLVVCLLLDAGYCRSWGVIRTSIVLLLCITYCSTGWVDPLQQQQQAASRLAAAATAALAWRWPLLCCLVKQSCFKQQQQPRPSLRHTQAMKVSGSSSSGWRRHLLVLLMVPPGLCCGMVTLLRWFLLY